MELRAALTTLPPRISSLRRDVKSAALNAGPLGLCAVGSSGRAGSDYSVFTNLLGDSAAPVLADRYAASIAAIVGRCWRAVDVFFVSPESRDAPKALIAGAARLGVDTV